MPRVCPFNAKESSKGETEESKNIKKQNISRRENMVISVIMLNMNALKSSQKAEIVRVN